jgi:uncharacterized protein YhbP (UPF0306 family)
MINYMSTTVERAVTLLTCSRFLVLATTDPVGETGPWAATVNYVVSDTGTLLFGSAPDALHSRHIGAQSQVAATVYHAGSEPEATDGVQLRGRCAPVTADELPRLHHEFFVKDFPNPDVRAEVLSVLPLARFEPGGTHRLYAITLTECWVRDQTAWSQTQIDRRIPVPVGSLINALTTMHSR